jgi:N-acetylneuraminate synthase
VPKDIKIGNKIIGQGHPPLLIAEMSGNHNQSLEKALKIVDEAALAGAHAVKIQTYTPDTMTLDLDQNEFMIKDKNSLWKGKSLYQLYKEAHTPYEWHGKIFDRCMEKGLIYLSTPFDETAVDFLERFNPPVYKVASFENIDLPLIKKIAKTSKPMIISTGMASNSELIETVETARKAGCKDIILLKCTSSYPASPDESNILTIPDMRNRFNVQTGISDHTLGIGVAIASVALGATVIEKHFVLDRSEGGVDATFSLEPLEFKILVDETYKAYHGLGTICYGPTDTEIKSKFYRRSIYVAQDIKKGESFTEKNLRKVRPGLGLAPKFYEEIIGKHSNRDLKKGTPMKQEYII